MRIALIGLGKMGANMARRLLRQDIEVVGYNRSPDIVNQLAEEENLIPAESLEAAIAQLPAPRIVWLMLPAGEITEQTLQTLPGLLQPGDIVVDGGNANYHDSQRRAAALAEQQIGYVDAGTSGGVWGLDEGYCMMVGGERAHVEPLIPVLQALAPARDAGWAHVGPPGAGHFTKMIHNGIEYGMMQAYAEGFALLQGKSEFELDLGQISELWRHGSVVRSWLLDLSAGFLQQDQQLANISPYVADSGEGRWTVMESIDQGTAAPVLALALQMRFASQDDTAYANRILAKMREAFGGHAVKSE
ncbi:phosphogluconate dehydrogenase (NAD(+)-dependent, decarboxylating) [Thiohalophilus thiocyanatoxydans]|uniref:6-phosphogluconate dehydrogenase n=1 Tax=Thiohalophilus thiocyanatoxydans TaxID=381308 RepID=A0A4R8IYQ5_9GAMM|nr:decarboxylating 6-phosphogluconate dehydrogenase [Thiohalophilus thiocyanatoxydans]TDY02573.1 6-phosphogluconate dehydrogenase [Thiohalophilus thiocyanatoxydans]